MLHGKNQIGRELSARGEATFTSLNPQTGAVVGSFFEATDEEVNKAVALAEEAFPAFASMSDKRRAEFLLSIAGAMESDSEKIIQLYKEESGLPEGRAQGEFGRTVSQLRAFAAHISKPNWRASEHQQGRPDSDAPQPELYRSSIPLGPIVVFGASNFPLAFSTAGGDTASALAAGCPVIVKGHPMHPGTGEVVAAAIAKAAAECGMPEGVFSNLNGQQISLGEQLVTHPGVKGVGFTGSLRAGRALYDLAAKREEPIPVFAEMGSVNPVILTEKVQAARGAAIAKELAASFTLGAGQFCTCPGLVLATGFSAEFRKVLLDEINAAPAQCMLGEELKKGYLHALQAVLQAGDVETLQHPGTSEKAMIKPSMALVKGKAFLANTTLQEEVFGPFTLLVSCEDDNELREVVSKLKGQLTLSLYAEEEELDACSDLIFLGTRKAGRLILNAMPTGVAVSSAMTHGGPYPASTDSRFTSVGTAAIDRWLRPVTFQGFPPGIIKAFEAGTS